MCIRDSSKVDSLLKDAMLEEMVNEHRGRSARLSLPDRQIFDDSLVRSVAERGREVMQCATMLCFGMVDDCLLYTSNVLRQRISDCVENLYLSGKTEYLCGMALGFDLLCAEVVPVSYTHLAFIVI